MRSATGPIWILPAILFTACSPDPANTRIIAHAGTGSAFDHPKNSREALLKAIAIGAHGIELDVQLTRDSVLVTYNYQDLGSLTPCSGLINSRSYAQLKGCAPRIDGSTFTIERVDSLLLEAAQMNSEAEFMLDCKLFASGEWWPYLETYTNALAQLNTHRVLKGNVMVECMVDDMLLLLQRKDDDIPLFLYADDPDRAMHRAIASRYEGIVLADRRISAAEVREARSLGLQVCLLNVGNFLDHHLALRKRPDLLQTDSPEQLVGDH